MPQVVYDMTLDVSVSDPGVQIIAKQGDRQSRLLCIRLTDCKKPLPIENDAAVLLNVATDEPLPEAIVNNFGVVSAMEKR